MKEKWPKEKAGAKDRAKELETEDGTMACWVVVRVILVTVSMTENIVLYNN